MKKYNLLIITYLLCWAPFTVFAQQNESTTNAYTASLEKREDFWSKVKYFFRPRYKDKPSKPTPKNTTVTANSPVMAEASKPVLVSKDPNSTQGSRKQYDKEIKKWQKENEINEKEESFARKPKEKKSFKQVMHQLLNGKDYVPEKSYGKKYKTDSDVPIKNEQNKVLPKANQYYKTSTTSAFGNTNTETKATEQKIILPSQSDKNNIKKIEKNIAVNKTIPEQKPLPNKVITEPEVVDNTIRNEIKPLSLNNMAQGNAGYFYSGLNVGKFYVVTNLTKKGDVVKITNPSNGKSLMAEVLDVLPASDVRKGLLIKISDNAKMPLGQQASTFTVKVNY